MDKPIGNFPDPGLDDPRPDAEFFDGTASGRRTNEAHRRFR